MRLLYGLLKRDKLEKIISRRGAEVAKFKLIMIKQRKESHYGKRSQIQTKYPH